MEKVEILLEKRAKPINTLRISARYVLNYRTETNSNRLSIMPSRANATRRVESSKVPAWVWLFTGAVLGAFIMFLMRLSEISPEQDASPPATEEVAKEPTQKPRFDFYDLLKESYVPTETKAEPETGTSVTTSPGQEFILQVASFRSQEDADQLRAQLILLNLEAYTENAKIRNGETWHRVLVGPFSSKSKLAKARSVLLSNRHEALVLKRKRQG